MTQTILKSIDTCPINKIDVEDKACTQLCVSETISSDSEEKEKFNKCDSDAISSDSDIVISDGIAEVTQLIANDSNSIPPDFSISDKIGKTKARFPCEQKRARVCLLESYFNTNNVYRLHKSVSARARNARGKKIDSGSIETHTS